MPKPLSLMPGPRALPIVGSVLEYSFLGKHSFELMYVAKMENMKKYGKIYKERMGRNIVQLFDPADIETVYRAEGRHPIRPALPLTVTAHRRDKKPLGLGSLNGSAWWDLRSAVQQTMMRPDAAVTYLPVQNDVADDFLRLIAERLDRDGNGTINDVLPLVTRYTTEAFGAVSFAARIGCLQSNVAQNSRANSIMSATNCMFQAVQKTTFSFPLYALYRTRLYTQFIESVNTCHRLARLYVDEALNGAAHGVDHKMSSRPNFLQTLRNENSQRLTNDEITQLAIDLFTAGIDSTAYVITFCLYNIANNATAQRHLAEELDTVLPNNAPVTVEAIARLRFLKACIKESYRLNFPVEGGAVREIEKDLVLSDYLVPKGTLVSFNYQTLCLQDEYFDCPDQYRPERWIKNPTQRSTLNQTCSADPLTAANQHASAPTAFRPPPSFSVLPYGYGPRMCIGRRFAEQEIILSLVKILQNYRLDYRQSKPVGMLNRVFTMPDRPVQLFFTKRLQNCAAVS